MSGVWPDCVPMSCGAIERDYIFSQNRTSTNRKTPKAKKPNSRARKLGKVSDRQKVR
jgi:hypothetical protein